MASFEHTDPALSMGSSFVFPQHSPTPASSTQQSSQTWNTRRPLSMQVNLPPQQSSTGHKRSATALPKFSFNSSDTSGLHDDATMPPSLPEDNVPTNPSRRGHRRGGSEFVGGDMRRGTSTMVSASPTKEASGMVLMPAPAPPAGRRGHAHRRSAAMSSHDVGSIMLPSAEPQPRQSSSVPNSPLDHPAELTSFTRTTSAPIIPTARSSSISSLSGQESERPPSRPRVGFSDNVEVIPRPLSTISSETEGSVSTVVAHSVNNSISSMLSLGATNSPSARSVRSESANLLADDAKARSKSSLEVSRVIEKEGEWLKSRSSQSLRRASSEFGATTTHITSTTSESTVRPPTPHKRKASMGHALGFDRRRSEPAVGGITVETSRFSTVSLQDTSAEEQASDQEKSQAGTDQKKSAKKIKTWAMGRLNRKTRDTNRPLPQSNAAAMRPASAGDVPVPGKVPISQGVTAETDLDAVFSSDYTITTSDRPSTPSHPRIEISAASPTQTTSEDDDETDLLDLDDATPSSATSSSTTASSSLHKQRKELHSARLNKDFGGPNGHYHRRADSAPNLAPSDVYKTYASAQFGGITDVFEEDEEDDSASQYSQPDTTPRSNIFQIGAGIQIVDSDDSLPAPRSEPSTEGLGIEHEDLRLEESPEFTTLAGTRSSSIQSGQNASLAEEVIAEEPASIVAVEIVEAYEEPRATSLEKSSDSSETPTVIGAQTAVLALPDGQQSIMTPDTYHTSNFSSPDFARRQGSFDTSRLGTSASSIADSRTMSSCVNSEQGQSVRMSVDDVPSLTSSRSTMVSTMPAPTMPRGISMQPTPSASTASLGVTPPGDKRHKRSSIQSLSQLVGFGPKSKDGSEAGGESQSEVASGTTLKKDSRLRKLMFWKSKRSQQSNV